MLKRPYQKAEVSFDLQQEIGHEGSNSKVHIAHDTQLDAHLVIKSVPKVTFDSVDVFFDEARILYLSNHPHVVPIHYACEDADHIYIAMPYYARGSLGMLLNQRFLTVREIVKFGCQVASGLHNVHSKRLIHFDTKPDNILLNDRGEAVLSDFGLARRMNLVGAAEQDRMYFKMIPPEVHTGLEFTHRYDIYQLGLTLYRMSVGDVAFNEQFDRYGSKNAFNRDLFKFDVRNGKFPARDSYPEHIPQRLRRLIAKCLEPAPQDRYPAVIDVCNELAQIDSRLDWQYDIVNGSRSWVCRDVNNEREFLLEVEANGASRAQKTMLATKRTTAIKDYCKPELKSADIKRFLEEHP